MEIDLTKPEAGLIIRGVKSRLRKGLGSNIFIIGLSGSGKSSTSIRISELLQIIRKRDTGIEPNIFIVSSLLNLIKAVRESKLEDLIVIEEVSVLFGSRRAMAGENVAINQIMDTIRKKKLVIISNCPIWKSVDSHLRSMGNYLIETLRISKTEMLVISKFWRLQTAPGTGKTYTHRMQRNGKDVTRMFTRMPSKKRWDQYESDKDKFMDELYSKLENEQLIKKRKFEKSLEQAKPKMRDLSQRELQVHKLFNVDGLNQRECGERLGITQVRVHAILKNIVKKSDLAKENSTNHVIKDTEGAIK